MSPPTADDVLRKVSVCLQEASADMRDVLEQFPLDTATVNRLTVIQQAVIRAVLELIPLIEALRGGR